MTKDNTPTELTRQGLLSTAATALAALSIHSAQNNDRQPRQRLTVSMAQRNQLHAVHTILQQL
jgi:hypothetical protein